MNKLPQEIHLEILSKLIIKDLLKMMVVNKYYENIVSSLPLVQNWMNPNIIAVSADAAFGTNKIIFCLDSFECNEDKNYDYIILNYAEKITFKVKDVTDKPNYSREKWYGNFSYTYRYNNGRNIIKLYNKGKMINNVKKTNTHFKRCYNEIDKINLSNGDHVFNMYDEDNIDLCLIFTRNNPEIKFYKDRRNTDESETDSDDSIFHNNYKIKLVDEYIKKIEASCDIIDIKYESKIFV